ncbi:MAG TPA: histidinol dehydrogenase, partial [Puia sp.]|nr:histidinol dehydrogenase [Puia sp.]
MNVTDIREMEVMAVRELLARPAIDVSRLENTVGAILSEVRTGGDAAVRKFSLQFDKVAPERLALSPEEMVVPLDEELKVAIRVAAGNIEKFHRSQLKEEPVIETIPGVRCWRKAVAIEKVGLYIPGGTAPLFSTLLMLAIPARIAGCREIVLCSPPDAQGRLHPALLYAAGLVGVTRVFRVGGVQAVGAMAYGTESIPAVYKIFGPGNQYVTCAKQLVQR